MKDRIRKLRKSLDLTQKQFAARIGMKSNTIATYEMGRIFPSDSAINNICKEFHVNEEWLRSGKGEMFAPAPTSALDALAEEQGLTHGEYILIEKLLRLKPDVRASIMDYILEVAAAVNSDDVPANAPAKGGGVPEMTAAELHAELDRQLAAEKMEKEESGAS